MRKVNKRCFTLHLFHMKFLLLVCTALLAGCAVYSQADLAQLNSRNLAPATLRKLTARQPLAPDDLIELHRRSVPDLLTQRQLSRVGVDSLFTRDDLTRLRHASVSTPVIDAAVWAAERFAQDHAPLVLDDPAVVETSGIHGTVGWRWMGGF